MKRVGRYFENVNLYNYSKCNETRQPYRGEKENMVAMQRKTFSLGLRCANKSVHVGPIPF